MSPIDKYELLADVFRGVTSSVKKDTLYVISLGSSNKYQQILPRFLDSIWLSKHCIIFDRLTDTGRGSICAGTYGDTCTKKLIESGLFYYYKCNNGEDDVNFDFNNLEFPYKISSAGSTTLSNFPARDDKFDRLQTAQKEEVINKFMDDQIKTFKPTVDEFIKVCSENNSFVFLLNYAKFFRESSPELKYLEEIDAANYLYLDWDYGGNLLSKFGQILNNESDIVPFIGYKETDEEIPSRNEILFIKTSEEEMYNVLDYEEIGRK